MILITSLFSQNLRIRWDGGRRISKGNKFSWNLIFFCFKVVSQPKDIDTAPTINKIHKPVNKQKKVLERRENKSAAIKSAQLIKRAYKGF